MKWHFFKESLHRNRKYICRYGCIDKVIHLRVYNPTDYAIYEWPRQHMPQIRIPETIALHVQIEMQNDGFIEISPLWQQ